MYSSVYDLFKQPPSYGTGYNAEESLNALIEIQDYFNKSTPNNRNNMNNMSLNHIYLPYNYYDLLKNYNSCGYRDGYSCWQKSGYEGDITSGYIIYIYDHFNDQLHYMGYYNRIKPDISYYSMKNYGNCTRPGFYIKCGESYLDDFMYSNKSSDIFITSLYFFIPILLFIIGMKVVRKGLFK